MYTESLAYCFLELYLGDLPWRFDPLKAQKQAFVLANAHASDDDTIDPLEDCKKHDRQVYSAFAKKCALHWLPNVL